MRKYVLLIGFLTFAISVAADGRTGSVYRWVDEDGVVHYDDSVPPEYAEQDKDILTDEGVKVGYIQGRKTEEELAAEARAAELAEEQARQSQADLALLTTYLSVEEIRLHRDRRVELFQAQSRVTELFLSNLANRLAKLEREASRYLPYSSDPDAPQISPDLIEEISYTRDTIERHESNLQQFQTDEDTIIARFQGDINRFKILKGIE